MAHQYKAGDVVTVFQISASNELVIEGKATIRKRVADVDEQHRVEFIDSWGRKTCRGSYVLCGVEDAEGHPPRIH